MKFRQEASDEEIVENTKKWMRDEVALVFEDYIGRRDDLKVHIAINNLILFQTARSMFC